jgi:adenosylcobinamide-GDP ribazoletransferase
LLAGRFLTRLPLPDPGPATPADVGRSALFYPLIGLVIGAALGAVALLASASGSVPGLAMAALLLIGWVWLTGALHLDGLADCADAWVGGLGSRARTLEILKDSSIGAMAVVAVGLALIAKLTALASLPAEQLAMLLVVIPAAARAQLLLLGLTTAYAREAGLGAALRHELPRTPALVVVLLCWAVVTALIGWVGLVAAVLAAAVLLLWRRSMLQRIGGFTGDTAGALVELTEAALLLSAALLLPLLQ